MRFEGDIPYSYVDKLKDYLRDNLNPVVLNNVQVTESSKEDSVETESVAEGKNKYTIIKYLMFHHLPMQGISRPILEATDTEAPTLSYVERIIVPTVCVLLVW